VETVWHGLAGIFGRLATLLWSAGSQFSLSSLACALLVAAVFLVVRRARKRRALSMHALARGLFPRRILRHRSARTDVGFFLFNVFVYAGIASYAAISYQFLTNAVLEGLVAAFGRPEPAMPLFAARASSPRCSSSPTNSAIGPTII
jgi:sterol desaturase/sphingolipid hydroxylase (fatty acid hydroxylase superfamily)